MGKLTGRAVLVVEDDPDVVETLKIVLEGEGCTVTHAADAEGGLAMVRAQKPDVILLDIMMPSGTEGFHFVWELRKDPDEQRRDIPIIVLTALHGTTSLRFYPEMKDPVYGTAGEFLPVQGFLDKPASSQELIAKVTQVLEQAGSACADDSGCKDVVT